MSNKLLIAVVAGFGLLMLMNFGDTLMPATSKKFISPNDVRGMDYEIDGKLWTLNFDQQNQVIDILNHSPSKPGVGKLIIYRFNQPNIELTDVGELQPVLSQTYDVKTTEHK